MRKVLIPLIVLPIALAACETKVSSTDEDGVLPKVAPANGQITLGFWTSLHQDCTSTGAVNLTVIEQPQHGRAIVSKGTGYSIFPSENPRSACNAKRTPGAQAIYKPEKNYTGPDRVVIRAIFPNGTQTIRQFPIEVK